MQQSLQISIGGNSAPFVAALDKASSYATKRLTALSANAARYAQSEADTLGNRENHRRPARPRSCR